MGTSAIDTAAAAGTGTAASATAADTAAAAATAAAATAAATAAAATQAAAGTAGTEAAKPDAAATAAAATAATAKEAADRTAAIKAVLKLPENAGLDPAVVERTTAIASELHLSPDHAQKMLGLVAQEAATHAKSAIEADLKSRLPGGAVWEQQNAQWKADALAHAELGGGRPEQLEANAALAKRVVATFAGKDAAAIDTFLTSSGLASHPATLGLLVRIGKAMREDQLVVPSAAVPNAPRDHAEVLYGGTK